MSGEVFAAKLRAAEDRLRAHGMTGRQAFAALCRHIAARLELPEYLWLEGPDAPESAELDRIPLTAELDLFGLAYERFFSDVFKAERGQYFTPLPLVELMADLVAVRPGERVLDPTCGSGSFLIAALDRGADVDGIEVDPELVALCQLNLALHQANPRCVRRADLFRTEVDETWDVILANPPFSVEVSDFDALRRFELARGATRAQSDVLFVEAAHRLLRPGGRLAVVLPHSIIANAAHVQLRDWIDARFLRRAIVALPEGMFRPFGGAAARACVLVLQKRPGQVRPWLAATVDHPGFDPTRKVYRRTEPDELAQLRIDLKNGDLAMVPATETAWEPHALLVDSGIGDGVPTTQLGQLAPVERRMVHPADEPEQRFTVVDLADVDKQTGEVSGASVVVGEAIRGTKASFDEGDILFGRIRPNLNNVVVATRPSPDLPETFCGSSEWVRMVPADHPYFALTAARSSFVRAQLAATGGQTRPRARPEDVPGLKVPDPGAEARALIDALVGEDHRTRLVARRRMDRVAELYEAFGRGELTAPELVASLKSLDAVR